MAAIFDAAAFKETPFARIAEDVTSIEDGFEYREEVGAGGPGFFRPEEESYYDTDLEIQPDADELDDFVEDFPGAPHESMALESAGDDFDDISDQGHVNFPPSDSFYNGDAASGYDAEPASEEWSKVTQGYGARPAPEYAPASASPLTGEAVHGQAQDDYWPNDAETIVDTAQAPVAQAQGYNEAVTDPWEEPLPAWDYSHSEYPVLLSPKRPRRRRKLWLPIAAGMLIVLVVSAYFVLSQPASPRPEGVNAQQNSLADQNGGPAFSAAQAPPTSITTEQQGAQTQAGADANQAQAPAQPPTEFGSAGTMTLQSAAFPDQLGASEFSQKLIRAGIPAYVVPVDLAGKGRWFRVRVGRFANADDAKKYAAQSRQRAKAAGMNVDFIVVEYGKP